MGGCRELQRTSWINTLVPTAYRGPFSDRRGPSMPQATNLDRTPYVDTPFKERIRNGNSDSNALLARSSHDHFCFASARLMANALLFLRLSHFPRRSFPAWTTTLPPIQLYNPPWTRSPVAVRGECCSCCPD